MTVQVVAFPFDQFGSSGTAEGARLLADVVREILADAAAESQPCRTHCLRGRVRLRECPFDTMPQLARWRHRGRRIARNCLLRNDFLIWLGGNHLSVLPVFDVLPPQTLVVQLDAHVDIHAFDATTPSLSHGNYLRHLQNPHLQWVHVGHRDLLVLPTQVQEFFAAVYPATELAVRPQAVAAELQQRAGSAPAVWLDIDCDVFDPAVLPAVAQPLPMGLTLASFWPLWQAIVTPRLLGVSISEFDPGRDQRDCSLHVLGWWLESLLLTAAEAVPPTTGTPESSE